LYGEGAAFVEAGMEIMTFMVRATKSAILPAIPKLRLEKADSLHALKGKREVFMGDAGEFAPTNVYEFEKLRPGNEVAGPAIIEAPTTTMYILTNQVGKMDEYRNLMIKEELRGG
jgi:N-methylhydantoinase A